MLAFDSGIPGSDHRDQGSATKPVEAIGGERNVSRVGPADEVGAALLREFGELLSRTLAPNASAGLKKRELVRAGYRCGARDRKSLDSPRLREERGYGRNRRAEDLSRAG
jgi:hypothetical protein